MPNSGYSAVHVPRILTQMSDPAELAEDDILGWELAQLDKLKLLAASYGWDEETPQYKQKLKQVQALGKQRLAIALGKGGCNNNKVKAKPMVWESKLEFKATGWDKAKEQLQKIGVGDWKADRRCPQTSSGGMVVRRFMLTDQEAGKVYLARIIDLQGGKWRLQRGNVEDMEPDEISVSDDEEEDDPDEDDGEEGEDKEAAQRRGAAAPAKKAARVAPAAAPPPEAAVEGKRKRKQRQA